MRVQLHYGRKQTELDVGEDKLLPVHRDAEPERANDPVSAVRAALEEPFEFPALRRALTPDDHVVIVVDEQLPNVAELLTPILEHVQSAGVRPEAITLLCPPSASQQPWLDDIPDAFEEVHVLSHDPAHRDQLSYLATTQNGRRIYLNRAVVDADQTIVLTRRGYDVLHGYTGALLALYPELSDEETRAAWPGTLSLRPPSETPLLREAEEVAWLLGAPFFVQIIEDTKGNLAHVVAGVQQSRVEGERLLNACRRVVVDEPADVVVACLGGDPERHRFAHFSEALANAARVVKADGRIVLLTDSEPALGTAAAVLRELGDSHTARRQFLREDGDEREAGFQWASAAEHATIYLLSRLSMDTAEDLLTVPLVRASEVQKLVGEEQTVVVLPDADRIMAIVHHEHAGHKIS